MSGKVLVVGGAILLASGVGLPAAAADPPAPTVGAATVVGGTGCPAGGTVEPTQEEPGRYSFALEKYAAAAGGTTGRTSEARTCAVRVPVAVAGDQAYRLVDLGAAGSALLAADASGEGRVDARVAGDAAGVGTALAGPLTGQFGQGAPWATPPLPAAERVTAPCGGGPLLVEQTVTVRATPAAESWVSPVAEPGLNVLRLAVTAAPCPAR